MSSQHENATHSREHAQKDQSSSGGLEGGILTAMRPGDNQQNVQLAANTSAPVQQLMAFQAAADNSPQVRQLMAMQAGVSAAVQRRENKTGLPDQLKSGVEGLSGMAMDDVKVHYNSDKPAQMQAHAYAQGTDIHVAPGQEKHVPHEAWHVVQQKQGRVQATTQLKGKVAVNDDAGLENEADVMGAKAMQMKVSNGALVEKRLGGSVAQRVEDEASEEGEYDAVGGEAEGSEFDDFVDEAEMQEAEGEDVDEDAMSEALESDSYRMESDETEVGTPVQFAKGYNPKVGKKKGLTSKKIVKYQPKKTQKKYTKKGPPKATTKLYARPAFSSNSKKFARAFHNKRANAKKVTDKTNLNDINAAMPHRMSFMDIRDNMAKFTSQKEDVAAFMRWTDRFIAAGKKKIAELGQQDPLAAMAQKSMDEFIATRNDLAGAQTDQSAATAFLARANDFFANVPDLGPHKGVNNPVRERAHLNLRIQIPQNGLDKDGPLSPMSSQVLAMTPGRLSGIARTQQGQIITTTGQTLDPKMLTTEQQQQYQRHLNAETQGSGVVNSFDSKAKGPLI